MALSLKETPSATVKPHVVVIPWPLMGHINPAAQFSKTLVAKGLSVTLLIFTEKKLFHEEGGPVVVEQISDEGILTDPIGEDYYERYRTVVCRELLKFIAGSNDRPRGRPCCVVYDSLFPWVLPTVKELGMMGAPFFTQPAAVNALYLNLMEGRAATEGFPAEMEAAGDLPSFVTDLDTYPGTLELVTGQLRNVGEADWVFCNTFYSLEEKLLNWMTKHSVEMKSVGPTIPPTCFGKEKSCETIIQYDVVTLFDHTSSEANIKQWLDMKPVGSVIYASLGSISNTSKSQITEMVEALLLSNMPFIWVVRESEQYKLPHDFTSNTTCLVVEWCHQSEVLAHPSVGCFVTHCGWNSTMEAISLGVPMVTLPIWVDQPTNAKFVEDVWHVGVRAKADVAGGVVTKEEIGRRIKEVMEGESGEEIMRNVEKWKRLAHEAVATDGSSYKNIDEFVTALQSRG